MPSAVDPPTAGPPAAGAAVTYAVGDVHGQLDALERLFARLAPDPERDHLWFVGDLVNRGPDSTGVLRWVRALGERFGPRLVVVLGNHDLRLLAVAAGLGRPRGRDTLQDVLGAPDREELCAWLRRRRLLHRRGDDVLVHAGLLPSWSLEEAEARAREAEEGLRGEGFEELLGAWRRHQVLADPVRERQRRTLNVLTGIRTCRGGAAGRDIELCKWKGPPEGAPEGCVPWFRAPERRNAGARVVFGHWAALGLCLEPRIMALDTGAAWGQRLTALRLEDGEVYQVRV